MQDAALFEYDRQNRQDECDAHFYQMKHAWIHASRKVYGRALPDHELCVALRVKHLDEFDWNNPHAFDIANMRLANYIGWDDPIAR